LSEDRRDVHRLTPRGQRQSRAERKKEPKRAQKEPKKSQKEPQRAPKEPQRAKKSSKEPKRVQKSQKEPINWPTERNKVIFIIKNWV